jgi:hypothetical protein
MAVRPDYDDGHIICHEDVLEIRFYYLNGRSKRIPYAAIRGLTRRPARGGHRVWGTGDFRHWFNLDWNRRYKKVVLILDIGKHIRPVITPDDPNKVAAIIESRRAGGP